MAYSVLQNLDNAHGDAIWACTWVKSEKTNESLLVTGSLDDAIKVWTWDEEKQLTAKHTLEGHCLGVHSLAANHDGSLLASCALDATVKFWDLDTGEEDTNITVGTAAATGDDQLQAWKLAFSPDSRLLAIATQQRSVRLFDVEARKLVVGGQLDTTGKYVMALAFSPDGRFLATASIDGPINLFDLQTSALLTTLDGHAMPVRGLAFSPDSKLLVSASDDRHIKVYDVAKTSAADVRLVTTLDGHGSWVVDVAFAPDGRRFATCSADQTTRVWDLAAKQCAHTFTAHSQQVTAAAFAPNGSRLASVSDDRSIIVYNTPV